MPTRPKPPTRQDPEFQGTVDLAARMDRMFGAPWVADAEPVDHPWRLSWSVFATEPPDLQRTPGLGLWRRVGWRPLDDRFDPEAELRAAGLWQFGGEPLQLNPALLAVPSGYGPIVAPLAQVAAIRALEMDARTWVRYADTRPGASQDRKARRTAEWHRNHAELVQTALDRYGTGWRSALDDLAAQPLKKPTTTAKRILRPVHFRVEAS